MHRVSTVINLTHWQRNLIFIFVGAFLIRGIFILTLQNGFYFADSVEYSAAAVNLLEHGEFGKAYKRAPVYPIFLAGIYAIFGENIIAIRIVQAFMGAFLAVVIAIIAGRIGGEGIGALAGLLWAIYPLGIFIAGLVYSESVAATLLACAVFCMATKTKQELGRGRVFLGGILFGLAALTKPVVLVSVALVTVWLMYWQYTHRLLLGMLFLLGVALPLTPWTIRNFYVYDRLVIVEPRLVQHLPHLGGNQKNEKNRNQDEKVKAILRNPGEFVLQSVRRFNRFWQLEPEYVVMSNPRYREKIHKKDARIVRKTLIGTDWTSLVSILSEGPLFFFALIGAGVMVFQKEQRRALSLLCGLILSFAIGYSFFAYVKMRYRIPVEPYIIMLSAYGLRQVWATLVQGKKLVREVCKV